MVSQENNLKGLSFVNDSFVWSCCKSFDFDMLWFHVRNQSYNSIGINTQKVFEKLRNIFCQYLEEAETWYAMVTLMVVLYPS